MVGDSYKWDYDSAKRVGVDALLINSEYESVEVKRTIKKLNEIFEYIS